MRKLLEMDDHVAHLVFDDSVYKDYIPIGYFGEAGIDNKFALVEMAGKKWRIHELMSNTISLQVAPI